MTSLEKTACLVRQNVQAFGTKHYILSVALVALASSAHAQSNEEVRFIKAVFAQIQGPSFQQNREYCGYLGFNSAGQYAISKVIRGERDFCEPEWPDTLEVVASFHTHAGFDIDAYSEVPSVVDIEADESEGVDGWVATPGGRLWFVDTQDMEVSQICGIGCLAQDPKFRPGVTGRVEQSYTYREMLANEAANP